MTLQESTLATQHTVGVAVSNDAGEACWFACG